MPLPNTSITVTGGIVRPALDKDGVVGLVLYNDNIADLTVFSATNRVVKFTNLPAIEATGITKTSTNFKEEHYQISEFFRNGGGEIWIGVFAVPAVSYDYTELNEIKLASSGDVRIYGVYNPQSALSVTDIALVEAIVASYDTVKKSAVAVLAQDISSLTLATLPDLRNLASACSHTSVVIGQDSEGVAAGLSTFTANSVPGLGTVLGTLADASVEENILNVGKYNYTDGVTLVIPGFFVSGGMVDVRDINEADLDDLNDKGYIFWRYFPNYAGTYLSNDNNCAKVTDTFNSIHINRVKGKVIRVTDGGLTPLVGSKLLFNANGTLRAASVRDFVDAAGGPMAIMQRDGEISDYEVYVDPTQESLVSKTVTVQISIVPTESADNIAIDISFVASI